VTCDEAIRAIEAMIDREIDDDERMQLEGHLAGCETCRREVEERRAFSERLGRDLNEAFGSAAPAARPVIVRPRRFPWARMAAVILVGVVIGYVGSSTGLFRPASAEAREVATLSALKEAYEVRNEELENRLEQAATALDRRASRAPEGPVRDAVTLCLMNAATGLAAEQPLDLPAESPERTRRIAMFLSSDDWAKRGLAVQATRRLAAADLPHLENQIFLLNGTNRTFTELVVTSMRASSRPAVTVEIGEGALHFVQLQNGAVRVETAGQAPAVCEANSILDFRVRYPEIARKLGLRGVDGYYQVAGVVQRPPAVESRPAAYVPAVVWNTPAADSPAIVEALNVHAVMAENARAGRSFEEIERRAAEVLRLYGRVAKAPPAVEPDPARVRRHLADLYKADAGRLMLAREKLQDDVAVLVKHAADMQRRLDCVSTAALTLDYVQAPK
jgi:hypothetical protein